MTIDLALMGICALLLILVLAWDNRHQYHIWKDDHHHD